MSGPNAEHYASILDSVASLPPLPANAQKILSAFNDEFIDADEIADIVRDDPAIVARLVGLANSAYYGLAEPVTCIEDAIGRVLGVEVARSVVLAIAMQRTLDQSRCPAFNSEQFWRGSMLAARCCKQIAVRDRGLSDVEVRLSYVTGLCHNIGLLALAYLVPDEVNEVFLAAKDDPVSLAAGLERRLGMTHREASYLLARHWSLPDATVEAYRCRSNVNAVSDCRLGLILIASTTAVGNLDRDEEEAFDLEAVSRQIGLAVDELQSMALPGQRQSEQISALVQVMI